MKPIIVGLAVALASFAFADKSVLETVTTKNIGQGVEIAIKGVSLKNPKVLSLNNGTSYVVQFEAHLAGKPGRIKVKHAGVDYVQYVWYRSSPATVRVHVKHDKSFTPELVVEDGDYFIRFNVEARPRAPSVKDADEMKKAIALLSASQSAGAAVFERPKSELVKVIESVRPGMPLAQQAVETAASLAANGTARPSAALEPTPTAPTSAGTIDPAVSYVSLSFSDTDVVSILRALAMKAGVNIATAPSVSPSESPVRITISLTDVALDDAMKIVTTLAGLRYGRVDNTYIVTKSEDFTGFMGDITGNNKSYTTRVVSLVSGEAEQIRDATIKAIPQDGDDGFYEIMVPSDSVPANGAFVNPPAGGDGSEGMTGGAGAPGISGPPARQRSYYLILVGEPNRLDEVEEYVESLDSRIVRSFSLDRAANIGTVVVPILSGETERIKTMLLRLLASNPRQDEYSIDESSISELSEAEAPTKVILMAGPRDELVTLERFAIALDDDLCDAAGIDNNRDPQARKKIYAVVDLMYIEPVIAEFDLKNRIRGLHVTVMPDAVSPGLDGRDETEKQSTPGGAEDTGAAVETDTLNRQIGLEPMRLLLRGTPAQIQEARDYLALIDIAPRQVALELRVMELTREEALKVGLDWSLLSGGRLSFFRSNQSLGATSNSPGTISATYTEGSSSADVLAVLDKMTNSRNLIARPNALVSDGRGAHLFVGDTIRYIKAIITNQNTTTIETGEVEVGVTFDILVRIGAGGNIAMTLDQNFSILNGFTPVPGGGQMPQTSDRKASMFVNMRSGETIALGGLIQDTDRKRVSGIPILMHLPIIGHLFRRTDNTRVRTEIVFFLTAVEVDYSDRANAASPRRSLKETPDPQGDYYGNGSGGKGGK